MTHTYRRGEAVKFNGAPAVILEVSTTHKGQLTIGTYAGWSSIIGDKHSGLEPLEMGASRVFAERVTEIRAYYGIDTEPWVSRANPSKRGALPDSFPESVLTYGVDYSPRAVSA